MGNVNQPLISRVTTSEGGRLKIKLNNSRKKFNLKIQTTKKQNKDAERKSHEQNLFWKKDISNNLCDNCLG